MTQAKHYNGNGRSYNGIDYDESGSEAGAFNYSAVRMRFPVLDREVVEELTYSARRGSKDSLEKLACSNVGLVFKIARKKFRAGGGLEMNDVIQNGMIGLLRAIEKYDPSLGYKFSTYAKWWIKQAIQIGYIEQGRTIRIPPRINEKLVSYMRKRTEEESKKFKKAGRSGRDNIEPSEDPNESVRDALKVLNVYSLNYAASKRDGEESSELVDFIGAPDNARTDRELREAVDAALNSLSRRERMVIQCRFFSGMSVEETTRVLFNAGGKKLVKEAVRRIEKKALERLRYRLRPYEEYAVA